MTAFAAGSPVAYRRTRGWLGVEERLVGRIERLSESMAHVVIHTIAEGAVVRSPRCVRVSSLDAPTAEELARLEEFERMAEESRQPAEAAAPPSLWAVCDCGDGQRSIDVFRSGDGVRFFESEVRFFACRKDAESHMRSLLGEGGAA